MPRTLCVSLVLAASTLFAQTLPPEQRRVLDMVNGGRHAQARDEITSLLARTADAEGRSGLLALLGFVENYLGNFEKARQALEEAIPLCEQLQPPAWAGQVSMMVSLAESHTGLTHLPEAYQVLQRALSLAEAHLGPEHVRTAGVLDGLGAWYVAQGNWSRAEASVRRALAIFEKLEGPDGRSVANETNSLVYILIATGRHGEALALAQRNTRTFTGIAGPTHPDTLQARWLQAAILVHSQPAEAESQLRAAMAEWTAAQPQRHSAYLGMLGTLVNALEAQRRLGDALAASAQALDLARQLLGPEHFHVVAQMYRHAALLQSAKRGREAAKLRKQAAILKARNHYPEPNQHTIDIWTLRGR